MDTLVSCFPKPGKLSTHERMLLRSCPIWRSTSAPLESSHFLRQCLGFKSTPVLMAFNNSGTSMAAKISKTATLNDLKTRIGTIRMATTMLMALSLKLGLQPKSSNPLAQLPLAPRHDSGHWHRQSQLDRWSRSYVPFHSPHGPTDS